MFALPHLRLPTHPHRPPPIDSIRVITEVEKTRGIQIASKISYEILAI